MVPDRRRRTAVTLLVLTQAISLALAPKAQTFWQTQPSLLRRRLVTRPPVAVSRGSFSVPVLGEGTFHGFFSTGKEPSFLTLFHPL